MHTKEIEFSLSFLFQGPLDAHRHELLPDMSLLTFPRDRRVRVNPGHSGTWSGLEARCLAQGHFGGNDWVVVSTNLNMIFNTLSLLL